MMECSDDGDPERQADGSFVQKRKLRWYGFTVPTKGVDEIYIASDLAKGASDRIVLPVLEATILHELSHWCRKVAGLSVDDEGPTYAFEQQA